MTSKSGFTQSADFLPYVKDTVCKRKMGTNIEPGRRVIEAICPLYMRSPPPTTTLQKNGLFMMIFLLSHDDYYIILCDRKKIANT